MSDIDELPSLDRLQSIHQDHGSDDEEVVFAIRRGISNDHEDPKLAEEIDGMIHKNRKLWPRHIYWNHYITQKSIIFFSQGQV